MKISSIHTKELSLLESTMSGTDRETRRYLRNMHENFVVPYVAYLNNMNQRLDEAELTPDQITQLFGAVSQGAQQAGGNETMLGKMMPDSIKKKFSDSLPPADAGEVAGFDQKAQAAVAQVQDPATKQSLMQLIKTGLQNPATQKLIIAGVQGIAGVAAGALTGGMGGKLGATAAGAITGGLVGLVAAKLQGQDWKSAAKAGLKGAAVGGAGGLVGSVASGAAGAAMDAVSGNNAAAEVPGASLGVGQELPDGEVISALDSSNPSAGVTITKPDGSTYSVSRDTAQSMTGQQGISPQATGPVSQGASSDPTAGVSDKPASGGQTAPIGGNFDSGIAPIGANGQPMTAVPMDEPSGLDNIKPGLAAPIGADGKPMQEVPMDEPPTAAQVSQGLGNQVSFIDLTDGNNGTMNLPDGTSVPVTLFPEGGIQPRLPIGTEKIETEVNGKPVTAYVYGGKAYVKNYTESVDYVGNQLKEYVDRTLTVRMWALQESSGKPRGGVQLTEAGIGGVMGSIGSWLKTKGQNLTQTVTADKLQQAWTKAGKPTDSAKIADLLQKQGVPPEVVSSSYQSLGIPTPGPIEPTMEPTAPTPAATEPAATAPTPAATAKAEPAAAGETPPAELPAGGKGTGINFDAQTGKPTSQYGRQQAAAAAGGSGVFADPAKLSASFEEYMQAGGKIPPAMRGVLKDILLTALRTVESRQRKLNNIVKEAKSIQGQLQAIKKKQKL